MDTNKLSDKTKEINKKRANLLLFVDNELKNSNILTKINTLTYQDVQQKFTNDIFIEISSNFSSSKSISHNTSFKINFKSLTDKNFTKEDESHELNRTSSRIDSNRYTTISYKKEIDFVKLKNNRNEYLEKLKRLAFSLKKSSRPLCRTDKSLKEIKLILPKKKNLSHVVSENKPNVIVKSYEMINDICDEFIKRYNNQELKLFNTKRKLDKECRDDINCETLRSFLCPEKKKKNHMSIIKFDSI